MVNQKQIEYIITKYHYNNIFIKVLWAIVFKQLFTKVSFHNNEEFSN